VVFVCDGELGKIVRWQNSVCGGIDIRWVIGVIGLYSGTVVVDNDADCSVVLATNRSMDTLLT
jgi:hypothetical protein